MRSQRLIALFGLGVVLFTYPLLSLFVRDVLVLGVPLLYGYLFCAWAALIGFAAYVVEGRGRHRLPPDPTRPPARPSDRPPERTS